MDQFRDAMAALAGGVCVVTTTDQLPVAGSVYLAAIGAAVATARPGDVVVVAGKGHERGQVVGETTLPFSDVDELRTALERTGDRR